MQKQLLYSVLFIVIFLKTMPLTSMNLPNNNNDNDNDSTETVDSQNNTESPCEILKNPHLKSYIHTYGTYATQGNYRSTMEDSHANLSEQGFHGIYDGHAGDTFAHFARTDLAPHIFMHKDFEKEPLNAIKNGFFTFNEKYFDKKESGTTATVIIFTDTSVITGNVGDSHAVLYSTSGEMQQLTENHHPDEPQEKERIEQLEKEHNKKVLVTRNFGETSENSHVINIFPIITQYNNGIPTIEKREIKSITRIHDSLSLSRAFGDFSFHPYITAEPFIQEIPLNKSHEFIIMASDGVWDAITMSAAGQFVQERMKDINKSSSTIIEKEAQKIAEELVRAALTCHDKDNATATIIFINHSKIN